jgi:hypothetical protein
MTTYPHANHRYLKPLLATMAAAAITVLGIAVCAAATPAFNPDHLPKAQYGNRADRQWLALLRLAAENAAARRESLQGGGHQRDGRHGGLHE